MRSKYGNVVTERDGIKFHSAKEARKYDELKLLQRIGEISQLTLQNSYPLAVDGVKICTYKDDFSYLTKDGVLVVLDVKGFKTPVYRLKAKLFRAIYGFKITEC